MAARSTCRMRVVQRARQNCPCKTVAAVKHDHLVPILHAEGVCALGGLAIGPRLSSPHTLTCEVQQPRLNFG
eukprot:6892594-Pyramimonas_sp.AAC.1